MLKRYFPLIAGIVFAGLVIASSVFTRGVPGTDQSAARVLAWYVTHKKDAGKGGFFLAWGVIAGVAFYGCVFARFRQASPVLAAVGLVGAAVFAVGGLLSAGSYIAASDAPAQMTASSAQLLNYVQSDVSYAFTIAGLAAFYLATAVAILKTKPVPIPRTWGWITMVFGLVALSAFFAFFAFLGSAVWVIVTGILLVIQSGRDNPVAQAPQTAVRTAA
jgi:hypothetical protein